MFSTKILHSFVTDLEVINRIEIYKGWFYVAVTGLLLYILINKEFKKRNKILRKLERAIIKAEESDRLKSAFLSNMSHYLRTPMNSILGFVDLLKNRNLDEEKRMKFLSIVNEQSNYLLHFIDNIIEISKLQEGQTQVNINNFVLNDLMRKIRMRYQTELEIAGKNKLVKLTGTFPENDITMNSDVEKIEYILTHLLSNSLKFTAKGEIEFGYELNQNKVVFYVFDTGCGIAPEKQKLITRTFMLSDPDVNKENIGIGFGLALSNGYVKLLKGRLWLDTSILQGTRFYISLPLDITTS